MINPWQWHEGDERSAPQWTLEEKRHIAKVFGISVSEVNEQLEEVKAERFVFNALYQVHIRHYPGEPGLVHLSIRSRENLPLRDWRAFQRIKNELVDPECEAVELYPAESRLVDTANQYHLWVVADPEWRFPFGFAAGRKILNESFGGSQQRGLDGEVQS